MTEAQVTALTTQVTATNDSITLIFIAVMGVIASIFAFRKIYNAVSKF